MDGRGDQRVVEVGDSEIVGLLDPTVPDVAVTIVALQEVDPCVV